MSTANSYDVKALLKSMKRLGLLEPGVNSTVNLLGEAIFIPRYEVTTEKGGVEEGSVFVFEGGSLCTYGMSLEAVEAFVRNVIRGTSEESSGLEWIEKGRYEESEVEVINFVVKPGAKIGMQGTLFTFLLIHR